MKRILLIYCLFSTIFSQAQTANPAGPLLVCEQNTDGFGTFDLTTAIPQILGSQNPADYGVTFYETHSDAQNGILDIANPTIFSNTVAGNQTIYVRVEELSTGNFVVSTLDLIVGEIPEANPYAGIIICDDTTLDGFAGFDLTQSETVILGGQNPSDFTITYYLTQSDAQNATNATVVPANFTNSSNPQTIYVRVENGAGCFATTSFPISVVDCSLDADNDLVATGDEDVNLDGNLANDDTDTDTMRNFEDNDDDGDGTLTADEDYNNNGDPLDDDTNANGIPDYLDAGVTFSVSGFAVQQFSMYPNPSKGTINLQFENPVKVKTILITNLNGKVVKEIRLGNTITATSIDLSMLSPGVYFVSVNTYQGNIPQKIVIE
ncbi:MAG TPA: T9SS type A sorting domain-containing protein [Flavobacteriaceae bacterium]|nr:T9SS type A sorting domain-containing protein [Flavobacteriaceae bacterium]